jgi:hypothetical protein
MGTEVVVATVKCIKGHTTEILVVSPVVHADGTVDGLTGSSADFCDTCDAAAEVVAVALAERELNPTPLGGVLDEDIYKVKYKKEN